MKHIPIPKLAGIETEYAVVMRGENNRSVWRSTQWHATQMLLSHSDAFPQGYSPGREFTAAGRFYPDH
ncbi:MAG: hypothetical protein JXA28_02925, partial [Bacteroidetes bacterium]|nr:hypothetical protein [Bacteroidota bacterium]